jgi:hypothetical protein
MRNDRRLDETLIVSYIWSDWPILNSTLYTGCEV